MGSEYVVLDGTITKGVCGCDSHAYASMGAVGTWAVRGEGADPRAKFAFEYSPMRLARAEGPGGAGRRLARNIGSVWNLRLEGVPDRPAMSLWGGPCGRPLSGGIRTWGRTLAVWMLVTWVKNWRGFEKRRKCGGAGWSHSGFIGKDCGYTACQLPTPRAGGGVSMVNVDKRNLFAKNQADLVPIALKEWGAWYGTEAVKCANKAADEGIGGSVANSTRHNYEGLFRKWEIFRGVNGKGPYLDPSEDKFDEEEESALSYVALSVGPLGKEASTMATHFPAIGFFHRVKHGVNPLTHMSRVQLMLKGLKRAKGPTNRKLPITLDDIRALKGLLNLQGPGQLCLWATILTGWFSMLMMSEFIVINSKHAPPPGEAPDTYGGRATVMRGAPRNGTHTWAKSACTYQGRKLTGSTRGVYDHTPL